MRVGYDPEVDVLSIVLSDAPVEESDEDKPGVVLDYDKDGNVVGIEILNASTRMGNPCRLNTRSNGEQGTTPWHDGPKEIEALRDPPAWPE